MLRRSNRAVKRKGPNAEDGRGNARPCEGPGRQNNPVEEREIATVGKVSVPKENAQLRTLRLFDPPARRHAPSAAGVKASGKKADEKAPASAASSAPASHQPVNP